MRLGLVSVKHNVLYDFLNNREGVSFNREEAKKLQKEMHLSLLFISHDLALVQALCNRILVMYQGKIVEEGTPDEVILHPREEYTKKLIDSVL